MQLRHSIDFSPKEYLQAFGWGFMGYMLATQLLFGALVVLFSAVGEDSVRDFLEAFQQGVRNSVMFSLMTLPAAVLFGWMHPGWVRSSAVASRQGVMLRGTILGMILGGLLGFFFLPWMHITVFMVAGGALSGTVGGWLVWLYFCRRERTMKLTRARSQAGDEQGGVS